MSRLALALSIAAAMVMPGAAAAQTNEDLLRELRDLRQEMRGRLLDQELTQEERWIERDDARERERQERRQQELERRIRGGFGPFPCCEPD